jgi:hypothetical protein
MQEPRLASPSLEEVGPGQKALDPGHDAAEVPPRPGVQDIVVGAHCLGNRPRACSSSALRNNSSGSSAKLASPAPQLSQASPKLNGERRALKQISHMVVTELLPPPPGEKLRMALRGKIDS